jgi:hypothetical protein
MVAISEVAGEVDLLVVVVPMKSMPALSKNLLHPPAASLIINTGNYYHPAVRR